MWEKGPLLPADSESMIRLRHRHRHLDAGHAGFDAPREFACGRIKGQRVPVYTGFPCFFWGKTMNAAARAVVLLIGLVLCSAAIAQAGFLPWTEVKKKVADHWSQVFPAEKVLGIEQKGGVEFTATQRVQEITTVSDWRGTEWITTNKEIQGSFARQVVLVSVERANKSRARFDVAAPNRGESKA